MDSDKFLSSLEQDVLIKFSDESSKDIIIMGDFNANVVAPKLWKYKKELIHATQLYGLNQLINEPTRVTEHTRSAIDLVFVNNSHRICLFGVQEFASSDHSIVFRSQESGNLQGSSKNSRNKIIQALQ